MKLKTFDNQLEIAEIYPLLQNLKEGYRWDYREIYSSTEKWRGKKISFPIISLASPNRGRAMWIISGIHGNEPAGPNAIAINAETIEKLGIIMPVVLLPLCNPHGYYKRYRYPNQKTWLPNGNNRSVGDSEYYLPDLKDTSKQRASAFSCPEAKAITSKVLELATEYPPLMVIDLHEDDIADKGYIYCSGTNPTLMGKVSAKIIKILISNNIPIRMSGKTRFNEPVCNGIAAMSSDGSIDELLSAKKIIIRHKIHTGPAAECVIVVETPATIPLGRRIKAHSAIILALIHLSQSIINLSSR